MQHRKLRNRLVAIVAAMVPALAGAICVHGTLAGAAAPPPGEGRRVFYVSPVSVYDQDRSAWHVWCGDLVDECTYRWQEWGVPDGHEWWVVRVYSPEVEDALFILLKAVMPELRLRTSRIHPEDPGRRRWMPPEPPTTPAGRSDFVSLLRRIHPPAGAYARGVPQPPDAAEARRAIPDLDAFPARRRQDHFLGGYARLYACILRMRLDGQDGGTVSRLKAIEKEYADVPAVAIMAAWYAATALAARDEAGAKDAFRHLARDYAGHDWWVVKKARWAATVGRREWQTARIAGDGRPH